MNTDNPCSGFVVEARKLLPLIPENIRQQAEEYIEDLETDALEKLVPTINGTTVESYFILGDEDTCGDQMDTCTVYALFAESDLFTKVETPLMLALQAADAEPIDQNWSIWG